MIHAPRLCQRFCFVAGVFMFEAAISWAQSPPDLETLRLAGHQDATAIKTARITQQVSIQHTEYSQIFRPTGLPSVKVGDRMVQAKVAGRSAANTDLKNQVEVIVDFDQRRWKKTKTDLRDLDKILTKTGATMIEVSQNRIRLCNDKIAISWLPDNNSASVYETIHPAQAGSRYDGVPLETGIVPAKLWDKASQASIEETKLDGQSVLKVTVGTPPQFTVWLDPKQGYRYRRLERYNSSGKLQMMAEASDYRKVNGIPFPFRHVLRKFDVKGRLQTTETRQTQEASMNQPLADKDFSIKLPEGANVSDLTEGWSTTWPAFEITLENARHLRDLLRELRKTPR